MAIKYVRTTGNDTSGDGSTGNPWATISKGLATIAAGDNLKVGTGTYAESTSGLGFLSVSQLFASYATVESESGTASDVVITGASNATYNTLIQPSGAARIEFKNLTFATRLSTNAHAVRMSKGSDITFTGVVAQLDGVGGAPIGFSLDVTGGQTVSAVTLTGCSVTQTGTGACVGYYLNSNLLSGTTLTNNAATVVGIGLLIDGALTTVASGGTYTSSGSNGIYISAANASLTDVTAVSTSVAASAIKILAAGSGGTLTTCVGTGVHCGLEIITGVASLTVTGGTYTATGAAKYGIQINGVTTVCNAVTLTNVTSTGTYDGLNANGCTNLVVAGGTYYGAASHGLTVGVDGGTGYTTTGSITGATIGCGTGHALLIGNGSDGVVAQGNTVNGGDYAVVVKYCTNARVTGNRCNGGSRSALYFKGAHGAIATGNVLYAATADGTLMFDIESISGWKTTDCQVTDNVIIANGATATLFYIAASANIGTGNVVDDNIYWLWNGAGWGTVLGTTVSSLATLAAAWSGYGEGTNDKHSNLSLSAAIGNARRSGHGIHSGGKL